MRFQAANKLASLHFMDSNVNTYFFFTLDYDHFELLSNRLLIG